MSKMNKYNYIQNDIDRINNKIFEVTEGTHKGCYESKNVKNKDGYSYTSINGKMILIHRLMYHIHYPDEDIDNKQICHRCDNPACVNPEHLFSGTQQDNITDKVIKGRQAKGSENGNSKLIESDIIEIINLILSGHFTSGTVIAKQYKVSRRVIENIINQKLWKHVTKDYDMAKVKSLLDMRAGSKHFKSVLNDDQVRDIQTRLKNGEYQQSIADFYHVSQCTVSKIANKKSYQDVV
jgi:hypothetical protein